jgi:hypothetical protein
MSLDRETKKISFLARASILIASFFLIDKILAFARVGIVSRIYSRMKSAIAGYVQCGEQFT